MPDEPRLYLEDIAVGMTFRSGTHRLDAAQIKAFATQFDPQAFHLDEAAAERSFFEGLAASGWHTMAITMRLLVESLPFAHGVIGAGATVAWPRPTRPTDVLRVESEVIEVRPSRTRPRASVLVRSRTLNQDGEVRQDFTATLLVFRRGVQA